MKFRIQSLSHTNYISSAHQLPVASGYCIGQYRYRIFPSLQKVLSDDATVEREEPWKQSGQEPLASLEVLKEAIKIKFLKIWTEKGEE